MISRLAALLLVLWAVAACAFPTAQRAGQPASQPALTSATATPQPVALQLLRRPTPVPQPTPRAVDGATLAGLSTMQQLEQVAAPLRDLGGLAQATDPALHSGPTAIPARSQPLQIGDVEPFWVRNTTASANVLITATLVYSTPVAYVWIEQNQPYDRDAIAASIDLFSQQTYPREVQAFGSEWRPGIDGDNRLHILYNTRMGNGVEGYFSSSDEYSKSVSPYSNQKEMFYINLASLNRGHNYAYQNSTLGHELQHMIHWHMDRGEDLWVNEGLSEYAQEVAGFGADDSRLPSFANDPDLQLTTWNGVDQPNTAHYASAYLFMAYLAQCFGPHVIMALVAAPENGMAGVSAALHAVGATQDAEAIFADWVVANYARQPDALGQPGRFGYVDRTTPAMTPADVVSKAINGTYSGQVYNFATDYIELRTGSGVTVTFAGDTTTHLTPAEVAANQRVWWSERSDDSNPRLTRRFDLSGVAPGTPVTLTTDLWWDIEADYDYGYVMASSDGEHWAILPGQHTRTDPDSGNAIGPGYSGQSMEASAGANSSAGSNNGSASGWVQEHYDLSPYAGGPLWLRFSYVTDDAVTRAGWMIRDVQLDAAGKRLYALSSAGPDGWESEGWLWTDNRLPQRWLVQVLEYDGDKLAGVRRVLVDDKGQAQIDLPNLRDKRWAVLAISGLAPVTTLPAAYTYKIETQP